MPRAHPPWSRPSRSPAVPAWLSVAGSSAACSAHWRSCAPSSAGRGLRPYFLDGLPKTERAVGDGKLGSQGKAAPFEIEKQLLPGLRALTHAVDQADELLLALGHRPDDHQKALRRV